MLLLGHDNSQRSPTITRPLTIWEGKQYNSHNFRCFSVIKTLFGFFNREIETFGRYPHLVASSYIKNDDNM